MYRDYAPHGVKFYYIYKSLAHPEHNGYVSPVTQDERLMHVREAQRTLGSQIPWLCDTLANDLKHALGNAPNSEFVIDPRGRVVRLRDWSDPRQLRRDLEELVGPVANPTQVVDLKMQIEPPPQVAARGVVPRIDLPGPMQPIRVQPNLGIDPFYVKLRAEAEPQLLQGGSGKLFLGFHLDPLYRVHWNNLAAPLTFTIESPADVQASPNAGEGPKVEPPSDMDPREFLVEVRGGDRQKPLTLTVRYFACSDEEGWCKPITQTYTLYLQRDPDGGQVQRRRATGR